VGRIIEEYLPAGCKGRPEVDQDRRHLHIFRSGEFHLRIGEHQQQLVTVAHSYERKENSLMVQLASVFLFT